MTDKELDLVLAQGESYRIEFKEELTNLDREMVAFANASGGFIYLGISDHGEIKGFSFNNKIKSQIQDIANNCDPPVKILIKELKNIVRIEVREGDDKPYRCTKGFYNRTGPNSQKMNRDEIIDFVKAEGKVRFDEMVKRDFGINDFDESKFERFLKMAGISKILDTPTILKNLHAADFQGKDVFYYNTAVLFFAKNLDEQYFHTTVTCALYKGKDKVTILDRKDFNKDIVDNIDQTMIYLKQRLNVRYEFDGNPARIEIPEIPWEALREAVINAVIHRNYFEKGANVMVEIFDDRVEITSPGGLPKGLKEEDFGKISILRNPNIANLMQRIDYIEKMGTGIARMQKLLANAGLKPLQYEFSGFVRAVFQRQTKITTQETDGTTPQATPQATPQVTPQVTEQATEQATQERITSLLNFCKIPRSRQEMQKFLGLQDREYFRQEILAPLITAGLLTPTIPDKPNSPKQKYVIVENSDE